MARVGQTIDGIYEIQSLLGQGGTAKVYLATDRSQQRWAVKEIPKQDSRAVQQALAEANLLKQLDHPALVRVIDVVDTPDALYVIEDCVDGESLDAILQSHGAQSPKAVVEWGIQLCDALAYLHTRHPAIIYRDVKPANILLRHDGTLCIVDFGSAREYDESGGKDAVYLGTQGYAAPEQFGAQGQTDPRTDVYGLGATLHHLVTGHNPCDTPWTRHPIRHWNPRLDPQLEAMIEKCTHPNPDCRYSSCAAVQDALRQYQKQKRRKCAGIAVAVPSVLFALAGIVEWVIRT